MEKNFFQKLFSPKFDVFITPSIASVVYLIFMVLTGLFVLVALIYAFTGGQNVTAAIFSPLIGLIFLIVIRSLLETSVALIKIAENTKKN